MESQETCFVYLRGFAQICVKCICPLYILKGQCTKKFDVYLTKTKKEEENKNKRKRKIFPSKIFRSEDVNKPQSH